MNFKYVSLACLSLILGVYLVYLATSTREKIESPSPSFNEITLKLSHYCEENPGKTIEYGQTLLKRDFSSKAEKQLEITIHYYLCKAYTLAGLYPEALKHGLEAEHLAKKGGFQKELADAYIRICDIYRNSSQFAEAYSYALEAHKIYEKLGAQKELVGSFTLAGSIIASTNKTKAFEYFRHALEIAQKNGDMKQVAKCLNNIGTYHLALKQNKEAMAYFTRCLELQKKQDNRKGIAVCLANIGIVHYNHGDFSRALLYHRKSLQYLEEDGFTQDIPAVCSNLATDFIALKQYNQAMVYARKGITIAFQTKDIIHEKILHQIIADLHTIRNDYKSALASFKQFKKAGDKLLNIKRNNELARIEFKYETQKQINLLRDNQRIQRLWLKFFILSSILIFSLAIVLYSRFRTKKKSEKTLRQSEYLLKQSNTAKDRLFTIIAHDLGSPLNSLLLSSTHLYKNLKALPGEDVEEFIGHIYRQTQNTAALLENLLEWSVAQLGKITITPEIVAIKITADETIETLRYCAESKNINITAAIPSVLCAWVDRHMLKAILRNLITNAVKYSFPGGTITITAEKKEREIEITVSDNGVGIPPGKIDQLFKLESQSSTRGTANEKGTGLGLMLCKEFVEKNNGSIRVQSNPNMGSSFSFTLPLPTQSTTEKFIE